MPSHEFKRLLVNLELVHLPLGQVLYDSGGKLEHLYFPTSAIVSILYVLQTGESAEMAIVGNEGVLGISLFMGGETTPNRAEVQSPGWAYRLSARCIKTEFARSGPVNSLLLLYTQALIAQITQNSVCNRHHRVDQQLCRWILLSLDRTDSNTLHMTQHSIANRLGVRRQGVARIASKLQRAGYIRYVRGHITVLDRPAIEERVCECYAVVNREFERLLARIGPGDPRGMLGESVAH
jgi:CRP-like cAMP-binding protein